MCALSRNDKLFPLRYLQRCHRDEEIRIDPQNGRERGPPFGSRSSEISNPFHVLRRLIRSVAAASENRIIEVHTVLFDAIILPQPRRFLLKNR